MLLLDLQQLLFVFLLLLIAVVALALWIDRRWYRPRSPSILSGLSVPPATWERAPFGLLVLQDVRTCRYANPAAQHLLQLEHLPCDLPDADWVKLLDEDRVAARKELAVTGRYRSVTLRADQTVQWWVTAYQDSDLIFVFDATAPARAEQAARFLISDLSHELRTPLATLLTHIEVLRLPHIAPEIREQSIHLMQVEAQRMSRLIHDLLELSRLESSADIDQRPVELRSLVEQVMAQLNPQAEAKEIRLTLQADTPLPSIAGDADRLEQVFINLLDNAIKYSRPHDRITISLSRDRACNGLACTVSDTGPGIPADHLPRVTRRFYRVPSEDIKGSGLGLALVEEILRRHSSHLEIESRTEGEQTGTRVRFVLPALVE